MRRVTLFLSFCCFFGLLSQKTTAQMGINLGYQINEADGWRISESSNPAVANGYKVGLDYWFRLKNKRIEFTPELSYAFYESAPLPETYDYRIEFFSFQFNTNFYLLDLLNDCNCPTFSKQNDFFKKGFFIRVAPGVTGLRLHHNDPDINTTAFYDKDLGHLQPMIGLGLGLDIGLSDLITISPILTANYIPNLKWISTHTTQINSPEPDFWQFTPTLRLGFRFDGD